MTPKKMYVLEVTCKSGEYHIYSYKVFEEAESPKEAIERFMEKSTKRDLYVLKLIVTREVDYNGTFYTKEF